MNITYNHNYVSYLPDAKKTLTVDGVQGYTNGGYFHPVRVSLCTLTTSTSMLV